MALQPGGHQWGLDGLRKASTSIASDHRRPEIEGLRALAVLAVVFCHIAEFEPVAIMNAVGRAGSRGVDLFFVISGFCLAYPILRGLREQGRAIPGIAPFLRRRFARVAPPYYIALLLFGTLAFTPFGLATWPYKSPVRDQLLALGQDLVFLTNWHPIHNCDFWTLGIEMRWYILFPLFVTLFVRTRLGFGIVMLAMYAVYVSPWGFADLGMYPCFMLGVVAADITQKAYPWRCYVWPFSLAALALALWLQSRTNVVDHGDPIWHVAAFLLVVGVTGNARIARAFSFRGLAVFGIASYSIYLIHHPIISELAVRGLPATVAAAIALAFGFAFWYGVERPLGDAAVRRRIESVLRLGRTAPIALTERRSTAVSEPA